MRGKMNENMISMFIDNELSIDDKIVFVETIHGNEKFKCETVSMLEQEKLIRSDVVDNIPAFNLKYLGKLRSPAWFRPFFAAAAGLAAAAILLIIFYPRHEQQQMPYRFVIYQPDARQVEIAGSFSDWNRIPMRPTGKSGYWETTIDLLEGEHRFSYIIEGNRRITDPTIAAQEIDDFGGENSILKVEL